MLNLRTYQPLVVLARLFDVQRRLPDPAVLELARIGAVIPTWVETQVSGRRPQPTPVAGIPTCKGQWSAKDPPTTKVGNQKIK